MHTQFLPEVNLTIIVNSTYSFPGPMPTKNTFFLSYDQGSSKSWFVFKKHSQLFLSCESGLLGQLLFEENCARKPVILYFLMCFSLLLGFKIILDLMKNACLTVFAELGFLFIDKTSRSNACLLPEPLRECVLVGMGAVRMMVGGPNPLIKWATAAYKKKRLQSQFLLPQAI